MKSLSICIPSIIERKIKLNNLLEYLNYQIIVHEHQIQIIYMIDNKELSIGIKRQLLLDKCVGEYCVMIDDDDWIHSNFIGKIISAIQTKPDCIGYLESVNINGKQTISCHSNKYDEWGINVDGYDYVRTIFCKDVIKTGIAKQIGFSDMRFGEDHDFAKRLKSSGLLKTEVFIDDIMYYYTGHILNKQQRDERYGILLNNKRMANK